MAKFSGNVGYIKSVQTEPGVWENKVIEKLYYGDLVKNTSRYVNSESTNDDININNNISIVADPFACENFQHMRYVVFMNNKWKISNVEVAYPRLILTIGGLYHGEE